MLNQNIASLEQQFKQKESRLLLTQDRLKRNIEALSNKNVLLQDEISLLEQDRISYVAERMLLTRKKQTHSISTQTITLVNNVSIQSEPLVDCQIPAKINIDEQANKTLTKIAQELNLGAVLDTIKHPAGKIEQCFENDISLFYYSNGTTKSLNKISNEYTLHFQNNDQKTFFADGSSEYLFYSAKIRSRTFKDGTVFNTFPDGQHETINVDGSRIQVFLDGTRVLFDGNGHEESFFPDGTHLVRNV